MIRFLMSEDVTSHVKRNGMSGLQTEKSRKMDGYGTRKSSDQVGV